MKHLSIRGARQNNLRNIDLDLPRERLVVITGLSGSGKSSLAFDTIYAEGQRRYVESLSVHARQFLEQMDKPEVDAIEGLSPAISIEQRPLSRNPRSTVGTVTEIYDFLRLLYARVGQPHCPGCQRLITSQSVQQMVDLLLQLPSGTRFALLAPVVRDRKGAFRRELADLRREGYLRVNVDGEVVDLGEAIELDENRRHTIEVYVDRLVHKPGIESRLTDSLELALKLGGGLARVAPLEGPDLLFSEKLACFDCGLSFPELGPRAFSFNSPQGACPRCSGLGVLLELDEERVVPDPALSLREGAIHPWARRNSAYYGRLLETLASQFGFDLFVPYRELPASVRTLLMRGSGELEVEHAFEKGGKRHTYRRPFEGVLANLQRRLEGAAGQRPAGGRRREGSGREEADELEAAAEELHRYLTQRPCPDCGGARLRPESRAVLLGGLPLHRLTALDLGQAQAHLAALDLGGREREIARPLLKELLGRLSFLTGVGLGYLSLDRPSATLSGGEGQRVRLATQIGSSLVGVLYILDEPSIGLHQRDHARLLGTLLHLRDLGNTVLVVEHDEETIRAADFVVDLGPGAGTAGGEVVAAGTVAEVIASPHSLTGQYLSGARRIDMPRQRRRARRHLVLRGASGNNLKGIDLQLPLGVLCCVTGVSGSGKSTLVIDTLLPALRAELMGTRESAGPHHALEGARQLERVIAVDQSPIGRTPRSSPATYAGVFAPIRELYAALPESKLRGYRAGRFSFNVKGGRCEACQGDGVLRIAMHFLPDIFVGCDVCGGRRYNRETLTVRYRGHSIADLLEMTVSQAVELLQHVPAVRQKLETLRDVGLGYLTLGQRGTTLSGGEAQRLKLSRELARAGTRGAGRTLYILDEPTTGLHLADIQVLLDVLHRLVDSGNTVLIIEHHLDVIKCADHLIDLGPEGGDGGGRVIATGTPEEVAQAAGSHTGAYLARLLARSPA